MQVLRFCHKQNLVLLRCCGNCMKQSYSVIVPVHNGAKFLGRTLPTLLSQADPSRVVVVDDGSTDDGASMCRELGVKVISMPGRSGAAIARNRGVRESDGEFLVFTDVDVLVPPDGVRTLLERLAADSVSAIFGSYDDSPSEGGFVSQYVNLRHHYTHQLAKGEAHTFWAGFGAVRRTAFEEAGGFDPDFPGVEDIALGYRLKALGHSIRIDPSIQVKHLKHWTFRSMVKADIFDRAAPWSRLKLSMPGRDSLNLVCREKLRALAAACLLLGTGLAGHGTIHWLVPSGLLLAVVCANMPMSRFFAARHGTAFAVAATAVHQLYYLYASATFVAVAISYFAGRFLKSVLRTQKA